MQDTKEIKLTFDNERSRQIVADELLKLGYKVSYQDEGYYSYEKAYMLMATKD